MQDFLSKVGKIASEAADKAGSKAGELVEIGKLKGRISSKKNEIDSAKNDIGEYCLGLFREGRIDDERIEALCRDIEERVAEIKDLKLQIEKVKEEYKAKNGDAAEADDAEDI